MLLRRYDPKNDTWMELDMLRNRRTKFGLSTVNGTLTAIGGWEVFDMVGP